MRNTLEDLAAKRRKKRQKIRGSFLRIGFALLAAIESGCFTGMSSTPEVTAEREEKRRKIRLRIFHLRSLFSAI
jgi:hypothetical protein